MDRRLLFLAFLLPWLVVPVGCRLVWVRRRRCPQAATLAVVGLALLLVADEYMVVDVAVQVVGGPWPWAPYPVLNAWQSAGLYARPVGWAVLAVAAATGRGRRRV